MGFFSNFVCLMSVFRFLCFGSGSSGNCFYFQNEKGAFLVDAGVGIRKMAKYFVMYGISHQNIKGIFLTHDHIDHVCAAYSLSTKYSIPVHATRDVWKGLDANPVIRQKIPVEYRRVIDKNAPMAFLGCQLTPFEVPHDSRDNVGYYITYGDIRLALVTDDGSVTDEIHSFLSRANHLIIESNYDEEMLRNGPYPAMLKRRISGLNGHLSNREAAETVKRHYSHLSHVWLCHISANNNTPQNALNEVIRALAQENVEEQSFPKITALNRTSPTGFFDL